MAYIYNPAESISQKFQSAQKGIENVFAYVIKEKQDNYKFAQDLETNIETLKKDVSKFGREEVYKDTNELLSNIGSIITKNGKIDYDQLRKVKERVSEIKSYKAHIEGYENLFEQSTKRMSLDKGNIYTNPPEVFQDLLAIAKDKKSITDGSYANKIESIMNDAIDPLAYMRESVKAAGIFGDIAPIDMDVTEEVNFKGAKVPVTTKVKGTAPINLLKFNKTEVDINGVKQPSFNYTYASPEAQQAARTYFGQGGPGNKVLEIIRDRMDGAPGMTDDQIIDTYLPAAFGKPLATTEDVARKYKQITPKPEKPEELPSVPSEKNKIIVNLNMVGGKDSKDKPTFKAEGYLFPSPMQVDIEGKVYFTYGIFKDEKGKYWGKVNRTPVEGYKKEDEQKIVAPEGKSVTYLPIKKVDNFFNSVRAIIAGQDKKKAAYNEEVLNLIGKNPSISDRFEFPPQ